MNWYKSQTLSLTRDIEYIREVTKSMSEPTGCPEVAEPDWEQALYSESYEKYWRMQQLMLTHQLASMFHKEDANEFTTKLAERVGLGKEFRHYLQSLNREEPK